MSGSLRLSKKLVAVCGKGGTGKTALTAMMTRVLRETDSAVKLLLIDADPAMGLPNALGVNIRRTIGQIREEIIRTTRGGNEEEKTQLGNMLDYMVLEALHEVDGFSLLAMGRTETLGCFCPLNDLLRGAIEILSRGFDIILVDGEAGLEQINRKVMCGVDILTIVSDATARGMQTAAVIMRMAQSDPVLKCEKIGLVFNKVQGNKEVLTQCAKEIGIVVFGYIPQDENIAYHDLVGKPIIELPTTSPALAATRNIVRNCILQ
jgi:CO dehydrogenase maturation factor